MGASSDNKDIKLLTRAREVGMRFAVGFAMECQDRIAGNRTEEKDNNDSNNTVICAVNDAANVKIEVKNCKINVCLEK